MVWGRLLAASALALSATVFGTVQGAEATNGANWKIFKTEWSAEDERGFGEFVRVIGESGCNSSIDCLRSPANPFLGDDPATLRVFADCADWPYALRAYYAWKTGLPFRYVNGVSGSAGDIRFSSTANQPRSKRDIVDHGKPANGGTILDEIRNTVSTATYRTDAGHEGSVFSDFYSPKLAPGSIRAGTVIYDVHGHVAIVFKIDEDGRIHYMDTPPISALHAAFTARSSGKARLALAAASRIGARCVLSAPRSAAMEAMPEAALSRRLTLKLPIIRLSNITAMCRAPAATDATRNLPIMISR